MPSEYNPYAETEATRRVALQVQEAIPANFEGNRLVDVIDYLRSTTGANIFVNWPALIEVGVEEHSRVSLQLRNAPASRTLELVLQQVGQISPLDPIGYSIIDGVVHIDTLRNLRKITETRIYDVGELLGRLYGTADMAELAEGGMNRLEQIEEIIRTIQDTVGSPEEWVDLWSTIRLTGDRLVVRTTADNHRQIYALLQTLFTQQDDGYEHLHWESDVYHMFEKDGELCFEEEQPTDGQSSAADQDGANESQVVQPDRTWPPPETDTDANSDHSKAETQKEGQGGSAGRRKRGRPVDTDKAFDRRIAEAWDTKQYKTYADLAAELSTEESPLTPKDVERAIGRHRKRKK